MSLLDVRDDGNELSYLENEEMWNEYEKLDAKVNQNLLEIDAILARCQVSNSAVVKYNGGVDEAYLAVGAALIWWNLAIYLLLVHSYLENKNRLMICWY